MKKKQWDAISDEKYSQIWHQIREAINPGHRDNTPASVVSP